MCQVTSSAFAASISPLTVTIVAKGIASTLK
jgi:hypothetical protein